MLITPQTMVEKGFVFSGQESFPLEPEQLQQIGLDVRAFEIMAIRGGAIIGKHTKQLPQYLPLHVNRDNRWVLKPGVYALECIEECSIPVGYEGKLIHRSTLNRSGCFITGSVYDPGYNGIIAGTMYVHNLIEIEFGARVAQFQMQEVLKGEAYNGDYQDQESHQKSTEKVNAKD